jgi:predicted acylesterase/phospholipase RssA
MDDREPILPARALAEEYIRLHGAACGPEDAEALKDDLPSLYRRIHLDATNGKPRTALAISGGGIRSATFALGIIQQLASLGILEKFDYLSTVSGGGYIGSWLSSFARRRAGGIDEASRQMRTKTGDPAEPEITPIRHLREYSNYLTPKLGLFSGDTWSMAANYLRNVILNWLMLVPLLVAMLILPRLVIGCVRGTPESWSEVIGCVVAGLLFLAIAFLGSTRPVETSAEEKKGWEHWIKTNGAFQLLALGPFVLAAIGVTFLWPRDTHPHGFGTLGGVLAGASLFGSAIYSIRYAIANRTQRRDDVRHESGPGRFTAKKIVLESVVAVASGYVFAGILYVFFAKIFPDVPKVPFDFPDPRLWAIYPPVLPSLKTEFYVSLAVPVVLFAFFLQAALFVGFSSWFSEDYDREWWARAAGWVLAAGFVWIALSALTIFGPIAIYEFPRLAASIGTITGALAIFGGKSSASGGPKEEEKSSKASAFSVSLGLAATIFAIVVLAALSLGTSEVLLRTHREYPKIGPDQQRYAQSTYELTSTATKSIATPATSERQPATLKLATGKYPALELDRYRAFRHLWVVDTSTANECLIILFGGIFVALFSSYFIGVNRFSMHAFYRNRLVRAYLGASRETRVPNQFTGFDPNDNFAMHKLRAETFWFHSFSDVGGFIALMRNPAAGTLDEYIASRLSARAQRLMPLYAADTHTGDLACEALFEDLNRLLDNDDLAKKAPATETDPLLPLKNRQVLDAAYKKYLRPCGSGKPFHVINTTLNLVSGKELAWQERKGDSMTISPLHCGNRSLGYRYSRTYGGPGGITLGTAVAISGAAASPNMGYNSSPALSFLLTLFNVRLGWWLGNPGKAGNDTYRFRDPALGLEPIVSEMLGLTDADHPYVYLSDGGHFENLALYEMVRRRCHCIIVSDAGSDLTFGFDDLGNAVRKIRIDLGIDITFEQGLFPIFPRSAKDPANPKYCAIGTINYKAVDGEDAVNGQLLYIKPTFYGTLETRDVYNYAATHNTFPHETTADQFFSESQFESYRALGELTIREMTAGRKTPPTNVCDLVTAAGDYINFERNQAAAKAAAEAAAQAAAKEVLKGSPASSGSA